MAKRAGGNSRPGNFEPVEIVERTCLKCDKRFKARGKFNRLCVRCTDANRGEHGLRIVPSPDVARVIRKETGNI